MIVRYIFPNKKGKFLGLRNEKLLKDKKKIFYFRELIKKNNKVDISKHHGGRLATFAIHNKSLKKAISYANYIEDKVTPIIC